MLVCARSLVQAVGASDRSFIVTVDLGAILSCLSSEHEPPWQAEVRRDPWFCQAPEGGSTAHVTSEW